WFGRTMVADFFIRATFPDPATGLATTMPDSLREEIARTMGVAAVDTMRFISARADGQAVIVIARNFSLPGRLPLDAGSGQQEEIRQRLMAGETVIGAALAERLRRHAGDTLVLETPTGPQSL